MNRSSILAIKLTNKLSWLCPGRRPVIRYMNRVRATPNYSASAVSRFRPLYAIAATTTSLTSASGISATDIAFIVAFLVCVAVIAWLSHKEIGKTLTHHQKIEKSLEDEYNILTQKVSERTHELVRARQAQQQELERVARFGELSKGLFHDMMSPLTTVSLYVEKLGTKDADPGETKQVIEKAVEASRRMSSFMESVKNLIGKTTDREHAETDVLTELETVKDLLAYKARMAGVRIEIGETSPIVIRAHSLRLQQVFMNLISNSIEACESVRETPSEKEKVVYISVKQLHDGSAQILISDNGSGLDADHTDQVFKQPFTTKPGGLGLGLMTVKSIVQDELHGTVHMKNAEIGGVCTTITIPQELIVA